MVQLKASRPEPEHVATCDGLETVADDRRRPGRPGHVSPTLIPLLRSAPSLGFPLPDEADLTNERGAWPPALGIAVGVVLSVPLWAVIGAIGWAILR